MCGKCCWSMISVIKKPYHWWTLDHQWWKKHHYEKTYFFERKGRPPSSASKICMRPFIILFNKVLTKIIHFKTQSHHSALTHPITSEDHVNMVSCPKNNEKTLQLQGTSHTLRRALNEMGALNKSNRLLASTLCTCYRICHRQWTTDKPSGKYPQNLYHSCGRCHHDVGLGLHRARDHQDTANAKTPLRHASEAHRRRHGRWKPLCLRARPARTYDLLNPTLKAFKCRWVISFSIVVTNELVVIEVGAHFHFTQGSHATSHLWTFGGERSWSKCRH
jgi:hypothetical protein